MIILLIKASLVLVILLAFYKLVLERESFFKVNRIYLLACLAFAFALPMITLPQIMENQGIVSTLLEGEATVSEAITQPSVEESALLPTQTSTESIVSKEPATAIETTANTAQPAQESATQMPTQVVPKTTKGLSFWLMMIYLFGVVVLTINLLAQIVGTLIKAKTAQDKIVDDEGIIVNLEGQKEPCSFFNYIFINPTSYDYDTYEQIIQHEKIHVKNMHSIDLLLSEIVVILLWFNPFIWFLRTEIEKNIEFQTDEQLTKDESEVKEGYQMNLLKIATYSKPLAITTNYNQSLIKQRILKMNAKKSNPYSYFKYAFIAPLLFGIILILNKPTSLNAQNISTTDTATQMPNELTETTQVAEEEPISDIAAIATIADEPAAQSAEPAVKTSNCKDLYKAAEAEKIAEVKALLSDFDGACIKDLSVEDKINFDQIGYVVSNEGKVYIDPIRELIVVESNDYRIFAETIPGMNDYIANNHFGIRVSKDAKALFAAMNGKDQVVLRQAILDLDPKYLLDKNQDGAKHYLQVQKDLLKNGASLHFITMTYKISMAHLSGEKLSKNAPKATTVYQYDAEGRGTNYWGTTKMKSNYEHFEEMDYSYFDNPNFDFQGAKDNKNIITYNAKQLVEAVLKEDQKTIDELLQSVSVNTMDLKPNPVNSILPNIETNQYIAPRMPLEAAAFIGNKAIIKQLLEHGADINAVAPQGATALVAAASQGHIDVIEFLVKKGADINNLASNRGSALINAASLGQINAVKKLIQLKAELDKESPYQGTALVAAANNGQLEVVKLLVNQGVSKDKKSKCCGAPILAAANNGHLDVVKFLHQKGVALDNFYGNHGTPLVSAANNGHRATVAYIIGEGINVNMSHPSYGTALISAANNGHTKMVEYLLKEGAKINHLGQNTGTALAAAMNNGHYSTVKLLLEAGADATLARSFDDSPMHIAQREGHTQIEALLRKYQ